MRPPHDHAEAIDANPAPSPEFASAGQRYQKAAYEPPKPGSLYSVRDKAGVERIIRVTSTSPDGTLVEVETLTGGVRSQRPVQLSANSLARQAAKGWCSLLLPLTENEPAPVSPSPTSDTRHRAPPAGWSPDTSSLPPAPGSLPPAPNPAIRLDSQNFGRCCADIARARINFSTQLIKDVGDGPFRAGNYQQAFITFEQLALGFTAAVAASRRAIAAGRRALNAQKYNLSGKEIQERTAAFVRHEQQINAAERSFATILEGLRMYLRTQQD